MHGATSQPCLEHDRQRENAKKDMKMHTVVFRSDTAKCVVWSVQFSPKALFRPLLGCTFEDGFLDMTPAHKYLHVVAVISVFYRHLCRNT